jgi:Cu/Ag efflux pump CusA
MTAFPSALGALLVFEGGLGKDILQPKVVIVVGSLFTSTVLRY